MRESERHTTLKYMNELHTGLTVALQCIHLCRDDSDWIILISYKSKNLILLRLRASKLFSMNFKQIYGRLFMTDVGDNKILGEVPANVISVSSGLYIYLERYLSLTSLPLHRPAGF